MAIVSGVASGGDTGVEGTSDTGMGVHAKSNTGTALVAESGTGSAIVAASNANQATVEVKSKMSTALSAVADGPNPAVQGNCDSGGGVVGQSAKSAGVYGQSSTANGLHGVSKSNAGVFGQGESGRGVLGLSDSGEGVVGESNQADGIQGRTLSKDNAGVSGISDAPDGTGVLGTADGAGSIAVRGTSDTGVGVAGASVQNDGVVGSTENVDLAGVRGKSDNGHGVIGESVDNIGVLGTSRFETGVRGVSDERAGVFGESSKNTGVVGYSATSTGVLGQARSSDRDAFGPGIGVIGQAGSGTGVYGHSESGTAVLAETASLSDPAVKGVVQDPKSSGAAIQGETFQGKGTAGYFVGNVVVTGHLEFTNADCAEEFCVAADSVEPGTVMVIDDDETLRPSTCAYDRRVAGVAAGAGNRRPAVILGAELDRTSCEDIETGRRIRLALVGRVWCKVTADIPIEVGDLLTTSSTPGHAMRVVDQARGSGAVLGKALRPLPSGTGLIPILVSLQ